jgi:2-amino-4-hydroxy-6-hydroxymethyldihydropteridine diphosphokinase
VIRSFIALGSNLDDPLRQLQRAVAALAALPDCRLGQVSPYYRNPAVGPGPQPDFINAVAELLTALDADALLTQLQRIETAQGRTRDVRWGPRTLDLDLLLYGDSIIDTPRLQVPHPRMLQRNFVLHPLHDIAPALILPDGSSLDARLDCCPNRGLRPL